MTCQSEVQNDALFIRTLGVFDLELSGNSLLNSTNRSNKIIDLLKYLITNRNKKLLPETIVEDLFPEHELSNPNNVLRSQIYRLRRFIKENFGEAAADEYMSISFVGRYYVFTLGGKAYLDVDLFEERLNRAKELKNNENGKAIDLYKKTIDLYKGAYLSEDCDYDWLILSRNYYSRLFINALFYLIEMLKEAKDYASILEICEEGIKIEPDEEGIHIYLIEALCNLGLKKHALSHYEFVTTRLMRELGVQPSDALKRIYDNIMDSGSGKTYHTIINHNDNNKIKVEKKPSNPVTEAMENDQQGLYQPLQCNKEHFAVLFELSKRRSSRQENSDYLAVVTLINKQKSLKIQRLKEAFEILSKGISSSLRMGDIFAVWSDNQILININNIAKDNLPIVSKRISSLVEHDLRERDFCLEIEYQPILSSSKIEEMLES